MFQIAMKWVRGARPYRLESEKRKDGGDESNDLSDVRIQVADAPEKAEQPSAYDHKE